jgi:hypothetical protein
LIRECLEYIALLDRSPFSTIGLGLAANIARFPAMNESQEFRGTPPRTMSLTNITPKTTTHEPAAVARLDINT